MGSSRHVAAASPWNESVRRVEPLVEPGAPTPAPLLVLQELNSPGCTRIIALRSTDLGLRINLHDPSNSASTHIRETVNRQANTPPPPAIEVMEKTPQ